MEDVASAIADFLRKKGGVGLFVIIDKEDGNTYTELANDIHVTRNTLTSRLQDAQELHLIKETRKPSDHGNTKRYQLTKRGERVRFLVDEYEMEELYSTFLRSQMKMEKGIDFIEEVFKPEASDPEYEEFVREQMDK